MKQYDYVKTRREDVQSMTESQQAFGKKFIKLYTRLNVWVFKKTKGRLWKTFPGGAAINVVGMKGAKSGKWREVALIHVPYQDGVLLVASQGGMDKNPVWYYNIAANPDITVTYGGKTRELHARQLSDEEKAEVWPHLLKYYPDFDEYQARTDRNIPVFSCQPART